MLVAPTPVEVTVTQIGSPESDRLLVHVIEARVSRHERAAIQRALYRLLGLDPDLTPFYVSADKDPLLSVLASRFRGMKPPRFLSVFETMLNAMAGQPGGRPYLDQPAGGDIWPKTRERVCWRAHISRPRKI